MAEIIPAILVESHAAFVERLRTVENEVKTVQIDIHDGILFPHTTYNDPRAVGAIMTPVSYELHLMVENPVAVAKEWCEHVPNVTRVIFHAEVDRQHGAIMENLRWLGKKVGIAINPETPVEEIHHDILDIDTLLIMTVHPGLSGQGMGDPTHGIAADDLLEKVRHIHRKYPELILETDGGNSQETIAAFRDAGISRFAVGSAIFAAPDPKRALYDLQSLVI